MTYKRVGSLLASTDSAGGRTRLYSPVPAVIDAAMQLPLFSSVLNTKAIYELARDYTLTLVAKSLIVTILAGHLAIDLTSRGLQVGSTYLPLNVKSYLPQSVSSEQP